MPKQSFLAYTGPFFIFMLAGWYGLSQVVQSKRDVRAATKGLNPVEEMDPVERLRQRYGLGESSASSAQGGGGKRANSTGPELTSIEEELNDTLKKVDIRNWDYKAVPRENEEE